MVIRMRRVRWIFGLLIGALFLLTLVMLYQYRFSDQSLSEETEKIVASHLQLSQNNITHLASVAVGPYTIYSITAEDKTHAVLALRHLAGHYRITKCIRADIDQTPIRFALSGYFAPSYSIETSSDTIIVYNSNGEILYPQ